MSMPGYDPGALLTPAEVAALFRVDPKTVTRWASAGKLSAVRTLGGHRRYHKAEVHELLGINGRDAPGGADHPVDAPIDFDAPMGMETPGGAGLATSAGS